MGSDKVHYDDPRIAAIQDKIAKAMYYESCCQNPRALWEKNDDSVDLPLVTVGERAYWRLLAYRAIEVMREEVGDK